jgi:hypothetical protein
MTRGREVLLLLLQAFSLLQPVEIKLNLQTVIDELTLIFKVGSGNSRNNNASNHCIPKQGFLKALFQ